MLTRVGVPVKSDTGLSGQDPQRATLLCFSHLRWNFVFQRPQHLMSRFAQEMDVIYWEEPVDIGEHETPYLQVREAQDATGQVGVRRLRRSSRPSPGPAPGHAHDLPGNAPNCLRHNRKMGPT